jgi:hypothetical protein
MNSIFFEIFRDNRSIYRIAHNENNGIMLIELDTYTTYNNGINSNNNDANFNLVLNFDRLQSGCDTFDFIISIIPRATYLEEYLSCNASKDNLPDSLAFQNTAQYTYNSYITHNESLFKSDGYNYYKDVELQVMKPTAFTIILEYIVSDTSMDIIIQNHPDKNSVSSNSSDSSNSSVFEMGVASYHHAPDLNGISVKKEIVVNLKKGVYIIRITSHKFFVDILKKLYESDISNLCFGFELEIEGIVLKAN